LANPNVANKPSDMNSQLWDRLVTDPFYPRFWEDRLLQPLWHKKPVGIFTVDMGELFGDWVPRTWQDCLFNIIDRCPQHRFYLLTKQPQNLIKFSPFPSNCFVGVTATANAFLTNALIGLYGIEARHKFISFEPLLGNVGIKDHMKFTDAGIDWVIIGAQTKPYKPPQIEWVEEIARACDKAGIPVFLKDNLKEWLTFCGVTRTQRDLIYLETGLRQEMPE